MTAELRRQLGPDSGIVAFAVHPGEVLTDISRSLPPPLPKLYRWVFLHILLTMQEGILHPSHVMTIGSGSLWQIISISCLIHAGLDVALWWMLPFSDIQLYSLCWVSVYFALSRRELQRLAGG